MRVLGTCAALAGLAVCLAGPAAAQAAKVDPALHCAALIEISSRMLQAAGQLTQPERKMLERSVAAILAQSPVPKAQAPSALAAHISDIAARHSDAEIADEIAARSGACLKTYGG